MGVAELNQNMQKFLEDPLSQINQDILSLFSKFKAYLLRINTLVDKKYEKDFSFVMKVEMLSQINNLFEKLEEFDPNKENEVISKILENKEIRGKVENLCQQLITENKANDISP